MDPRTWCMFQDAMLDIMKDLKFFPPPHLVTKWKLEGKLGEPGGAEKRGTPQKLPSEYGEYEDALRTVLGTRPVSIFYILRPVMPHKKNSLCASVASTTCPDQYAYVCVCVCVIVFCPSVARLIQASVA